MGDQSWTCRNVSTLLGFLSFNSVRHRSLEYLLFWFVKLVEKTFVYRCNCNVPWPLKLRLRVKLEPKSSPPKENTKHRLLSRKPLWLSPNRRPPFNCDTFRYVTSFSCDVDLRKMLGVLRTVCFCHIISIKCQTTTSQLLTQKDRSHCISHVSIDWLLFLLRSFQMYRLWVQYRLRRIRPSSFHCPSIFWLSLWDKSIDQFTHKRSKDSCSFWFLDNNGWQIFHGKRQQRILTRGDHGKATKKNTLFQVPVPSSPPFKYV